MVYVCAARRRAHEQTAEGSVRLLLHPAGATKREIEECHRALIEALGKPERRLVLKIIDAKDHISEDTSLDSFISGFRLAWRLSAELNHYDDERPARCQAAEKPGARFTLKKEDDEQ